MQTGQIQTIESLKQETKSIEDQLLEILNRIDHRRQRKELTREQAYIYARRIQKIFRKLNNIERNYLY